MEYSSLDVPVPGGRLAVGEWRGGDEPILAVHGLSSTHRLWSWTAGHLSAVRLIAPDLRGRGASQGLGSGYGLETHRDDLLRVLDHLEIDRATVIGMSLGGFISVMLAAAAPDRVSRLLLVDGGFPMAGAAAFANLTREQLAGVFRDRLDRLGRDWVSLEEYRDFFIANTAPLLDPDDPVLRDYLAYDLVGEAPRLRVRMDAQAIADDSADLFLGMSATAAAESLSVPTRMLFAQWSVGRDSAPGYTARVLEPWAKRVPGFQATLLPGTDHAATVMTDASGAAIAAELGRF